MKKALVYFLAVIILGALTLLIAEKQYFEPKLKEFIETQGSTQLGTPLTVEKVNLNLFGPLAVTLHHLRFNLKQPVDTLVSIPNTRASISLIALLERRLPLSVTLDGLRVDIQMPPSGSPPNLGLPSQKPAQPTKVPGTSPLDQMNTYVTPSLELSLQNASITVTQDNKTFSLSNIQSTLNVTDLAGPMELDLSTDAQFSQGALTIPAPLKFHSVFTFKDLIFQTSQTKLELGGLEVTATGNSDLRRSLHSWNLDSEIPDLKNLKIPPKFLPQGQWSGGLSVHVHIEQNQGQSPHGSGNVKIKNIKGQLNLVQPQQTLKGEILVDGQSDFHFQDKTPTFKTLLLKADLRNLQIERANQFSKPAGTPFFLFIEGAQEGPTFRLKTAQFTLSTLNMSAAGTMGLQKGVISKISLNVPRTSLTGFEKFFPPLSKAPLTGFLECKASLEGDLQDPTKLNVNLNPLNLENVKTYVDWTSADKSQLIKGPMSIGLTSKLIAQGQKLLSAQITSQLDLSDLLVQAGTFFHKNTKDPFRIHLIARQKKEAIDITSSRFSTSAGQLELKGSIREPQAPRLDLSAKIQKLDLTRLGLLVPMIRKWKVGGHASGQWTLKGSYNFAGGIPKSPLTMNGSLAFQIPRFSYKSQAPETEDPASKSKPSAPSTIKAEPLLPPWPFFKNSQLAVKLNIDQLDFNQLKMSALETTTQLRYGTLSGSAKIKELFGGEITAPLLRLNLLEAQPTTTFQIKTKDVDLAQALAWGAPQWKELAKGLASGQIEGQMVHPSRGDFIDATKASGSLKITNGFLSTLPFDHYMNMKLSSIPGIGKKELVKTTGASANIDASFVFSQSTLHFNPLKVLTPHNDALDTTGWIKVDKTLDLKGNVYLATPPVQGGFREANADSSGRLVVPVHITGTVTKPELNLGQETLSQMLSKHMRYEADKAKKQLQEQARSKAQEVIRDGKSRLQDELQKNLKNVLKQ